MPLHTRLVAALVCLACASTLVGLVQPASLALSGGTGTIKGKVYGPDGKKKLAGVEVLAYHLSSETVSSATTNRKGAFEFVDMPYGYFDFAVVTADGLFASNHVLNLAPATQATLFFTVKPYPPSEAPREFPGSDQPVEGMAGFKEKLGGRDFWRSPKGVAILGGLGAVTLLAIAGGGSEAPATVVTP